MIQPMTKYPPHHIVLIQQKTWGCSLPQASQYFIFLQQRMKLQLLIFYFYNQQGRKITSNSYLECEHCSVIKDWHNHSKWAKEPLCSPPAALLITLGTMADTRAAANGIVPVVLPNRTAMARSGPHKTIYNAEKIVKMTVHSLCHCNKATQTTSI